MFTKNYHAQVSKHLSVFQEAVDGLKKVQKAIRGEITQRQVDYAHLGKEMEELEATIGALGIHHSQIDEHVAKISQLLPVKEKV
jgi:septation ring formation regulator EzrA